MTSSRLDRLSHEINGRYRLTDVLGKGGMGTVYQAFDRLTRQSVALKQVNITTRELHRDKLMLALTREFSTLAGLRHPNIVEVLDYGFTESQQPYFTMRLIENGKPITSFSGKLSLFQKVDLLAQLLQALAYLHRRKIIHRDLKPSNVMVTEDGKVQVMDFGLAVHQADALADNSSSMGGTLKYMPLELFAGKPVSKQSDLYAVGVMAYELFVGRHPHNTQDLDTLQDSLMNKKPDLSTLEPGLASVIDRLLRKKQGERYGNADIVIHDLYAAIGKAAPLETDALRESYFQAAAFVGREKELNELETWLTSKEEEPRNWLIGGVSGVGKSRLLDELRIRALTKGMIVVRGQAVDGGGLPYQVWRDPLRRLILSIELTSAETSVLKPLIPDLAILLGRDIPDSAELEAEAAQQRLINAMVDVFRKQTTPVLLLLEDLQWAGDSLGLLKRLNDLAGELQLKIVGTSRDDENPELPGELSDMQHQQLHYLQADDITRLSESMLGEIGKEPRILEFLKRETEGNPFFMVEIARELAANAGRLQDIEFMSLPDTVSSDRMLQINRAHLNRIPVAMQPWLKIAAVAGRRLDLNILEYIVGEPLDNFLNVCADWLVLEIVDGGDGHWRFTHDKLRETAIADLSGDERVTFNRQVAEAIEHIYPDDKNYIDVLIEYWDAAGNIGKTLHYVLLTCERMINFDASYSSARQLLDRGLILLEKLPESQVHQLLPRFTLFYGDVSEKQSEYENAARSYRRVLKLTTDAQEFYTRALNNLGWIYYRLGHFEQAKKRLNRAGKLAAGNQYRAEQANSFNYLGVILLNQGKYIKARKYFDRAIQIYTELHMQQKVINAINHLGMNYFERGKYSKAHQYIERAYRLYQQLGDIQGMAGSLVNLGLVAYFQENYIVSRDYINQSLEIFTRIGDKTGIAFAHHHLATLALHNGDYDEAYKHLKKAGDIYEEIGATQHFALYQYHQGLLNYLTKNYNAACDFFSQSVHTYRKLDDQVHLINSLNGLAAAQLALNAETVKPHLSEALNTALSLKRNPDLIMETLIVVASLRLNNSKPVESAELLGFVAAHPSTNHETRDFFVKPLHIILSGELESEVVARAMERGKNLTLDEVIKQVLAEDLA